MVPFHRPPAAWRHPGALVLFATALLLLSPACLRPVAAKPSTLYISTPLIEADPLAVCNDGSSQQYYFKESTHAKMATVWLVYLAPGLWCWNASSCALRLQNSPWDAGSSKWPATRKRASTAAALLAFWRLALCADDVPGCLCLRSHSPVGGVFDDDPYRNPLAGANLAYVGYCTSDAYAGDTGATSATAGLAFRGGHTVQAILTSLARVHGLGTTGTPEQVILAGCAAGGRGVLYNIDYAGQYVARSVTVRALIDSAVWLDVPPLSGASGMTLQEETAQMLDFTNASGRLSPGCAAQYTGDEAWKCLYGACAAPCTWDGDVSNAAGDRWFPPPLGLCALTPVPPGALSRPTGQYRLPFVKVPYFVAQAQFDKCVRKSWSWTRHDWLLTLSPPIQRRATASSCPSSQAPRRRTLRRRRPPTRLRSAPRCASASRCSSVAHISLSPPRQMATFMNAFPMGDQPYSGSFVPACFTSCMSISSRFFKMVVFSSTTSNITLTPASLATMSPALGTTFNTALHSWLWDRQTPQIVELCPAGSPAPDASLPWCGTCRNKSDPLYDEYLTYRKDNRPPAPHAPPPLSRLALHTSGTEHLGRFTALCLFGAVVIGLGASYAKHVGAARNAPGARGFASDTDMEVAGERRRLLRAGDVDFDDESGEGGRPMRSFGALADAGRGTGPGGFTLADDTGSREYPKGARGALARLAADLSTAPGGAGAKAKGGMGWATAADKGRSGGSGAGNAPAPRTQQPASAPQQVLGEGAAPGVVGAKAAALMSGGRGGGGGGGAPH